MYGLIGLHTAQVLHIFEIGFVLNTDKKKQFIEMAACYLEPYLHKFSMKEEYKLSSF